MLVSKEIPALWNGVSQQPATSRLPSQAQAVVNCYPTVVDGLRKRPPAIHVAKITTDNLSSAFIHTINRDVSRRYTVVFTDGDLKVYDLAGNPITVTFPYGKGYLNVDNATKDFAAVTVADYTFVVNKTISVNMEATGADTTTQPSDYWWLNQQYISADLGGIYIPEAVQRQYVANPAGGTFKGTVQSFAKLPDGTNGTIAPVEGDIWKITGTDESNFTTYYVRRSGGVWDETVAPSIKNRIDAETMPWALVQKADLTFEFAPFSWADRRVGDESTNPNPSFVGRTIRDVFFYKNRLGFAVEEGMVLSRVGDFGNFYRLTVVGLLDDEVVDMRASDTKVTQIFHAVPFDGTMMAFSDQVQFRVTEGANSFTPTTAALKPATQFTMKTAVRPLPIGGDVYFVVENGEWAQLREYFVRDNAVGSDAADITGHVPKYIPAGVTQLSGSPTHDVLFAVTSGAPSRLYVYKFYWTDNEEKPQSAWSYWQFDSDVTVLSCSVLDNDLYVILKRADGSYIERIPLESGNVTTLGYQVYLDRRTSVLGTYLPESNRTEWQIPYPVPSGQRSSFAIVRGTGFGANSGALAALNPSDYTWIDDDTVQVPGNFSAAQCYLGKKYTMRYQFSPQFFKNRDNVAVVSGRFMLRTYTVYFTDTAFFETEVAPYGTDPDITAVLPASESNFDSKTIGQSSLVLGAPNFSTGRYQFGVYGDATVASVTLVNGSPYASTFTQAEYEGFWHNRANLL